VNVNDLTAMNVIKNNVFYIEEYCYHYNKIDCIALHKLIHKFFYQLATDLKIDFSYCLTLPQLAMEVTDLVFLIKLIKKLDYYLIDNIILSLMPIKELMFLCINPTVKTYMPMILTLYILIV
jgi:hypothetical protein